ncbi:MAG: hypothetical protein EHM68_07925 [Lysobacterales bacterium]|nr:MAG: hypothetical protein EHM68_07925 [Xanthomonadales bacterium]
MSKFNYAALAAMMIFAATTSYAQTADGQTPAEETGCDGQSGAAFGLCNAYCEAMDCDSELPQASDEACATVLDNFIKITGAEIPACGGSDLPQAGEACGGFGEEIVFDLSDAGLYGCGDTEPVILFCNPNLIWVCSFTSGG